MEDSINAVLRRADQTQGSVHEDTLMNFHRRLGHLNYDAIIRLAKDPASGIKITDERRENCLTCAQGKQTKNRQSTKDTGINAPTDRIGGVICSDLKGPMTPKDRLGNRYMINFVDHKTNYCRIFLAKTKDQAAKRFEHFVSFFENQFNCRVRILRTDGGLEYNNVDNFCRKTGIGRQKTEPYNSASNGKAERYHRTIMDMARSMIFGSNLGQIFWGDALLYACYMLNRVPCRANPRRESPIQMLTGKAPNLTELATFGSLCTAYRNPHKSCWKPRAEEGRILGKSEEVKGYKVLLIKSRTVVVTQHVKNIKTFTPEQNSELEKGLKETEELEESKGNEEEKTEEESTTDDTNKAAERRVTRQLTRELERPVVNYVEVKEPKSYTEAMKSNEAQEWKKAVNEELKALEDNQTWKIVTRKVGMKPLHSKFVFKIKQNAEGEIERYKARLVACGNEQVYGKDYLETFAPVMDLMTVRIILILSQLWNVAAKQGDVPNAYVRADSEEKFDIYMYIPKALTDRDPERDFEGQVLQLQKSLYGLKQGGRLWNNLLDSVLIQNGYERCITELCLYVKAQGKDMTVIGIYVDDLLIVGTTDDTVKAAFKELNELKVKDLGDINKFLGVIAERNDQGEYSLSQAKVIEEVLEKYKIMYAKPVLTPITQSYQDEEQGPSLPPEMNHKHEPSLKSFQSLAGSLLWIMRCTRPDIAFALHAMTRKAHSPTRSDWNLGMRVLRYLIKTKNFKLNLGIKNMDKILCLQAYSDADWAASKTDRKSVSGIVVMLNGAPIIWQSKKQSIVALSTMEAEYVAAVDAVKAMLGIYEMLTELKCEIKLPLVVYCDNQAAIAQLSNESSSGRSKHMDLRLKFVQDLVKKNKLKIDYVKTDEQLADFLTKPLTTQVFKRGVVGLKLFQEKMDEN